MQTAGTSYSVRDQSRGSPQRRRQPDQPWASYGRRRCKAEQIGEVTMSTVDLHPVRNNPDLPPAFQEHLLKRIDEQDGQYGLAWRLIRRYRTGRYCLAQKAGGKLCFNNAVIPGDGPRGRCGWHGGTDNSGPKTAVGKKRIGDAQRLRWVNCRAAL